MKQFFLLVFASIVFISCNNKPQASFTINKGVAVLNEEVSFKNTSQKSYSYVWDFGNGTTSTEKEPKIVYTSIGEYTVKLTAFNRNKRKTNSISQTISITKENYIINCNIAGSFVTFLANDNNPASTITNTNNDNPNDIKTSFGVKISKSNSNSSIQVMLGNLSYIGSAPSEQAFQQYVAAKSYIYNTSTGVSITYFDENSNIWRTNNQANSSSKFVVDVVEYFTATATQAQTAETKGSFSATLYNQSGQTITISEGTFFLPFRNLQ
jgi:PKD repeat protein